MCGENHWALVGWVFRCSVFGCRHLWCILFIGIFANSKQQTANDPFPNDDWTRWFEQVCQKTIILLFACYFPMTLIHILESCPICSFNSQHYSRLALEILWKRITQTVFGVFTVHFGLIIITLKNWPQLKRSQNRLWDYYKKDCTNSLEPLWNQVFPYSRSFHNRLLAH